MEKLTLELVSPYFTDGIYVLVRSVDGEEILPITAIHRKDGTDIIQVSNSDFYPDSDDNEFSIKLILRQMDLTKPITVEGKEIIPIVELAKIAFTDRNWEYNAKRMAVAEHFSDEIEFWYSDTFKSFNNNYKTYTPNQYALFKWLFKHKFDVFGLIKKRIAIDLDTLAINPYTT